MAPGSPLLAAIVALVAGPGPAAGPPGSTGPPPATEAGAGPARPRLRTGPDTLVLEDDAGRTVRFDRPPGRIVSLAPAFTEILFALGAGDRLVGRTKYGVHPRRARRIPSVGEGVRPSLEMIVDREPDAVLLFAGAENRKSLHRLAGMGIPTLALEHDGFGDLYRNLERLGRLTGRSREARRLAEGIRCRLHRVSRWVADLPRRRVYYEVWADPPITIGEGSYLDSLLSVAGATNVFGDMESPSPRVGLEAIVAREPELILVPAEETGRDAPPPSERPGWEVLEAVREGRVRVVDGDLVHRLGPRLGEAARVLARTVHPGLASGSGLAFDGCAAAPGAVEVGGGTAAPGG